MVRGGEEGGRRSRVVFAVVPRVRTREVSILLRSMARVRRGANGVEGFGGL